jgi:protease I
MSDSLSGRKIAIIATDGVEQVELEQPREAVEQAGAETELLSLEGGEIQAMNGDIEPADKFTVDKTIGDASADDYAGLILPGGTVNADRLRADDDVIAFV